MRLNKIKNFIPPSILLGVVVSVCWLNLTPGTFLTGWDNLHPEFNFKLNILRSLSAVWQEYQGLGLLGGMAHAADLPRQLILWLFSLVMPVNFLRYFWTFLMLALGPLGVYFLGLLLSKGKRLAAVIGALFYLFNLATVQVFFTPFDSFVSFFGFFPWLLLSAIRFLERGKRKDLLVFVIVSFFASCVFYVQTLFVVYFIFLLVFVFVAIFRFKFKGFTRSVGLLFSTLFTNAFWLAPVIYFTIVGSNIPVNSKANSIATPETRLMNEARSQTKDLISLKGYWFDYYDWGKDNKFEYLYQSWIEQTEKREVKTGIMILFCASLLGLVLGLFKKKNVWGLSGAVLFAISFVMLGGESNPITGGLNRFLGNNIPLFTEVFRNAFTKWSTAMSLVYALGLVFLFDFLSSFLKGKLKYLLILPFVFLVAIQIVVVKPIFSGNLISSSMRVVIPDAYFNLISDLNSKEKGRIVDLPAVSFWGWSFYDWGYRGSGFLWYGLESPVLDRAFDVWSPYNETFYSELKPALDNNNQEALERILDKYQIKYLILDGYIFSPGNDMAFLGTEKTRTMLEKLPGIQRTDFGKLSLYERNIKTKSFVNVPESYVLVNADTLYAGIDPFYEAYGNYLFDEKANAFPFVNFDRRTNLKISTDGESLTINNPEMSAKAILPMKGVISEEFKEGQGYPKAKNCSLGLQGTVTKERLPNGVLYKAEGNGVGCDYFYYPTLRYDNDYLLHLKGTNIQGRGLKVYLQNSQTRKFVLEELLPTGEFDVYFLVLRNKNSQKGKTEGYTLSVETRSFGQISSENKLELIEFMPIDYSFFSGVKKSPEKPISITNNIKVNQVKQRGTFLYEVDLAGSGVISLNQAHDPGWLAFGKTISKDSILKHTQMNSWANAWYVPEGVSKVYVLYWPQALEWAGGILGILNLF